MKSNVAIAWLVIGLSGLNVCPADEPSTVPSVRVVIDLEEGWRFQLGDFPNAMMPAFDDSAWRSVNVPHDWSIEGPFSADYASGNGYAPGGLGWYRQRFRLDSALAGKSVILEFDGVYDNSEVWINGQFEGLRPYGYSSFAYDLTPYVRFGDRENVIAVRVDHSRFADSRWYTGSGIYRHVRLRVMDKLHISHWGTSVTTPRVKADSATVHIETLVQNDAREAKSFSMQLDIISPQGEVVGSSVGVKSAAAGAAAAVARDVRINHPQLWSPESPALYTLRGRVLADKGAVVDETSTPFGVRAIHFDPNHGFSLNGRPLKLKGVCIHHDAGCLGAAVPYMVLERRLRALKEIGVNAIRTSHNPPAPELLDLCDQLGFLVKDEAFDEFTPPKNKWVTGWNQGQPSKFGYGEFFEQWSVTDIQDMVRRDRNHPSVVLWSIGNEIDYANDPFSHPVLGREYRPENPAAENLVRRAQPLIAAVKSLDQTRPVTAALATVAMSDAVGLGELLDAVGYNYQESRYPADHKKYPKRILYGSETSHQYDAWRAVATNEFVAGQFLWTGIDYLGEARQWPNRASGAGLLDLCGFKKPLAWFRQSLWSDRPMVYLCVAAGARGPRGFGAVEHWNWQTNSTLTVQCYANCPEVTLTLNDQLLGTKPMSEAVNGVLSWRVPYEPGILRASGRSNSMEICSYTLRTAAPAARIQLLPETKELSADGNAVSHVEYRIVDAQGVRVPDAATEINFELSGPARIIGIENGDLSSTESCQGPNHRAYHGRGLAILQATRENGAIILKATAPGLDSTSITLNSVRAGVEITNHQ